MKCLTEGLVQATYSAFTDWLFERIQLGHRMSRKSDETDVPAPLLKNDSARQRWELFHRAIAHAKQSNLDAMEDCDVTAGDAGRGTPLLSVVR